MAPDGAQLRDASGGAGAFLGYVKGVKCLVGVALRPQRALHRGFSHNKRKINYNICNISVIIWYYFGGRSMSGQ